MNLVTLACKERYYTGTRTCIPLVLFQKLFQRIQNVRWRGCRSCRWQRIRNVQSRICRRRCTPCCLSLNRWTTQTSGTYKLFKRFVVICEVSSPLYTNKVRFKIVNVKLSLKWNIKHNLKCKRFVNLLNNWPHPFYLFVGQPRHQVLTKLFKNYCVHIGIPTVQYFIEYSAHTIIVHTINIL